MKIVSVIPLKKGIEKGILTYFSSLDINQGDIVTVPMRNKKVPALVTATEELRDTKSNIKGMNFNLKKVIENQGKSIFPEKFMETIGDTTKYFAQNSNHGFTNLIPRIFIEEYLKISKMAKQGDIQYNKNNLRAEKYIFQYPFLDRMSIYKTLIRESFARGKSIFIVVPTELDIDKFTQSLSKGIEQFSFSLSSGNSAKKNLLFYEKIITAIHPVLIICTPPFLSIPRENVGTIILEHESSPAYKMLIRPYFDLRIFTEIFASKINARFIIGDDLLRFETIGRKEIDNLNPLHPLAFRTDFEGKIEILERKKSEGEKFKILEDQAVDEITSALKKKENIFIFSLRKGLATMTICKDCGNTISCNKCMSPLVLYISNNNQKRIFVCNKCDEEKDPDTKCDICGGWNLLPLGIGTDTVYEYIAKNFPYNKVFKLDKENAKTAAGAKKIIKDFEAEEGAILVGTEMALLYFGKKVPVSIIASFDSLWTIPNFKISEKILRILLLIISQTEDKLIIQTKNSKDEAIQAVLKENLLSFIRKELDDRKMLNYPPYKKFIKVSFRGEKEETTKIRNFLKELFADYNPEIFSSFIPKMKGKYLTNMLIKVDPKKWSLPTLTLGGSIDEILFKKLVALPPSFEISVSPEDLL